MEAGVAGVTEVLHGIGNLAEGALAIAKTLSNPTAPRRLNNLWPAKQAADA